MHGVDDRAGRPTSATWPPARSSSETKVQLSMRLAKRPLVLGLTGLTLIALLVAAFAFTRVQSTHAASGGFSRTISSGGVTSPAAGLTGNAAGVEDPEFAGEPEGDAEGGGAGNDSHHGVDRSLSGPTTGHGRSVSANKQAKSNPELNVSFNGLNFRQQRLANGGNQFSVEPPDQGMCAGNGFVVETVNDVFRVFHTDGTPATGVVDLNSFYGYPPALIRPAGVPR